MATVTILVIACILYLVASIVAIGMFVDIAREKGRCKDGTGALWFVGLFATPLCLGLLVNAMPEKKEAESGKSPVRPATDGSSIKAEDYLTAADFPKL